MYQSSGYETGSVPELCCVGKVFPPVAAGTQTPDHCVGTQVHKLDQHSFSYTPTRQVMFIMRFGSLAQKQLLNGVC